MGMYSAIWFECVIKPEFDAAITEMLREPTEQQKAELGQAAWNHRAWETVARLHPHIPELAAWAAEDRANHIPFAMDSMHVPYEWPDPGTYEYADRRLEICANLKHHNHEFAKFIGTVLPLIAESVSRCTTIYCEFVNDADDGQYDPPLHAVVLRPYPHPPQLSK